MDPLSPFFPFFLFRNYFFTMIFWRGWVSSNAVWEWGWCLLGHSFCWALTNITKKMGKGPTVLMANEGRIDISFF